MTQAFSAEMKIEVKLNPKWKAVEGLLVDVMQIAARNVERMAKEIVPVDTGATRNSIEAREADDAGLAWSIGPTTSYAPFLEFGTVYMEARPFLIPSAEKEQPKIIEAVKKITDGL